MTKLNVCLCVCMGLAEPPQDRSVASGAHPDAVMILTD